MDKAQVTNYDTTAELLATWREKLPPVLTVPAYAEAVRLADAIVAAMERFEKSPEFKRITGAQ
jgi:hypothetical protein